MSATAALGPLVGSWSGTDRLWFEPGRLANDGAAAATVRPTLDGHGLVHEARWTFGEDVHHTTMLIVATGAGHQVALADTFHTAGGIMALATPPDPDPDAVFDVLGSYDAGGESWGWRVMVHQPDHDRLEISAWNISPGGDRALAVRTELSRDVDPALDAIGGAPGPRR